MIAGAADNPAPLPCGRDAPAAIPRSHRYVRFARGTRGSHVFKSPLFTARDGRDDRYPVEEADDHIAQNAQTNGDEADHLGFLRCVLRACDIACCYFSVDLRSENDRRYCERPTTEYRDDRR